MNKIQSKKTLASVIGAVVVVFSSFAMAGPDIGQYRKYLDERSYKQQQVSYLLKANGEEKYRVLDRSQKFHRASSKRSDLVVANNKKRRELKRIDRIP